MGTRSTGWTGRWMVAALALMLVAWPLRTQTQTSDDAAAQNAKKARVVLDQMIKALGGPAWLNQKNVMRQGQVAAFFHGRPDVGTTEYFEFHQWPDHDR